MSGIRIAVLLVVFLADSRVALAAKQDDKEMNALAKASGCFHCHRIEPGMPARAGSHAARPAVDGGRQKIQDPAEFDAAVDRDRPASIRFVSWRPPLERQGEGSADAVERQEDQ